VSAVLHLRPRSASLVSVAVSARPFGTLPNGSSVDLYTVAAEGIEIRAMTYGAIITSLKVPDRAGRFEDVVLGHSALDPYLRNTPYLGAVVGRYANRIAHGRFLLGGIEYRLAANDGPHHLHGGVNGFDRQRWNATEVTSADGAGVTFTRTSPAGEEHYPGALECSVTYLVTSARTVEFRYAAVSDAPTIVNLTQHTYFNLAGEGSTSVLDHELTLHANYYTPVDRTLIPTGQIASVEGSPFDFRQPRPLRQALAAPHPQLEIAAGFDHNFILQRSGHDLVPAATLRDPHSGRFLEISTTEPGLQFYAGQLLDGTIQGAYGRWFGRHAGLCLETQHFPDTPHHPHFPTVILRAGDRYTSSTRWHFATD
jgi:aldose 1-epimerase